MCACLCLSVHVCTGRDNNTCVCASECLEWVCFCLRPSVHYEVVGFVNTYVCASECLECVCLFVSMHVRMAGVVMQRVSE